MSRYLDEPMVRWMQADLIRRYGGSPGLRDPGGLAAAVNRPLSGYYPDTIAEAAALFESLVINHPFVDGNKRVAFAAMDVFLRRNGYRIKRESQELHADLMRFFATKTMRFDEIEHWLRGMVVSN